MKTNPFLKTSATGPASGSRSWPSPPVRQSASQASTASALTGKLILLVDDDPTVRDSLNDVLVSEGYVVIPGRKGEEALELVGRFPVDLVLLDLNSQAFLQD